MDLTTVQITLFHDGPTDVPKGFDNVIEGIRHDENIEQAWYSPHTLEDVEDAIGEGAAEAAKSGMPVYTVTGYYTDNHQPYSNHVQATSPEGAARETFKQVADDLGADVLAGTGLSYEDAPLEEIAFEVGLEIISIVEGVPNERVFDTPLG
jgi:hypothetical protein